MIIQTELFSFDPRYEMVNHLTNGAIVTKQEKYNWDADLEKGVFVWLDKRLLSMDKRYQRYEARKRSFKMAGGWKWTSCGTITVMRRDDGIFVVVDGQHRVIASWYRSDIEALPCIVFRSKGLAHEAEVFVELNSNRKSVTAFDKYKANLITGDSTVTFMNEVFAECGLTSRPYGDAAGTITCISLCQRLINQDPDRFRSVISMAATLAKQDNVYVSQYLVGGLGVIESRIEGGLSNQKLAKKLTEVGAKALVDNSKKMAFRNGRGGEKVWAEGMLEMVNRSRGVKFTLDK